MVPPPPPFMDPGLFALELIFSIIAVIFCFLIYRKTKESYELTKHEGLQYFRNAFLFFGLSYFLRFLFGAILLSSIAWHMLPSRPFFPPLLLLIVPLGYFSTIGVLYLVLSSTWKNFRNKYTMFFVHGIALFFSVFSILIRSRFLLLALQTILLIIVIILSFRGQKWKKVSQIRIIYLLVAALWLINIWIINNRRLAPLGVELVFQAISLGVFFTVYYKVSKWTK